MPRMIWPKTKDMIDEDVIIWARDWRMQQEMDKIDITNLSDELIAIEHDKILARVGIPTLEEAMQELTDAGWVTWAREDAKHA